MGQVEAELGNLFRSVLKFMVIKMSGGIHGFNEF